jgi:hypothetical protein
MYRLGLRAGAQDEISSAESPTKRVGTLDGHAGCVTADRESPFRSFREAQSPGSGS